MNNIDLISRLSSAFGPSGCEGEVTKIIEKEITPYADSVYTDTLGNLVAVYKGKSSDKKLLLSAHTDEVGFMVSEIEDTGMLRFSKLGGIDNSVLLGKRVTVGDGRVRGVISSTPFHLIEKDKRCDAPSDAALYIDIGANSKEEAAELVSLGDFATFESEFLELGAHKIKGKALDDRAGAFIMTELLRRLYTEGVRPDFDLVLAFTVREELGLSGAGVAAVREMPNAAIVLETTAIADLSDTPEHKRVAEQGEGAVISALDRSSIYPRDAVEYALDCAKRHGIPAQIKKFISGGNDAAHIGKALDGIRVLAMSLPTRYLHSPACVVDKRDICSMLDHIYAIITDPKTKEVLL